MAQNQKENSLTWGGGVGLGQAVRPVEPGRVQSRGVRDRINFGVQPKPSQP